MQKIFQFPCLNDNYGFIIKNEISGKTVCIDSPDAIEIIAFAKKNNLVIHEVWNTHWHQDHAGGNQALVEEFGAKIFAPHEVVGHGFVAHNILKSGDVIDFDGESVEIIDLSGHTMGQIGYWFKQSNIVFVGDALFVLGCGRLFEGSAKQAHDNLENLIKLPKETMIYCSHEYALANVKFCSALKLSNPRLKVRMNEIEKLRAQNLSTVPTNLGIEIETNPFLLADFENLKFDLGLGDASKEEVFAHLRKAKDNF